MFHSSWRETLPSSSSTLSDTGRTSRIFSWSSWWVFILPTKGTVNLLKPWSVQGLDNNHLIRSSLAILEVPVLESCVQSVLWGLFLTRPDSCYREVRLKEQIFRVRGGVVWAPGNLSPCRTLTWLWQEMEGETSSQWSLCFPEIRHGHHGNCHHWLHPLFHHPPAALCSDAFLSDQEWKHFWAPCIIIREVGVERGKGEHFPLRLPTVDVHSAIRAAQMKSLFLCGHLTSVDQIWPGGQRVFFLVKATSSFVCEVNI